MRKLCFPIAPVLSLEIILKPIPFSPTCSRKVSCSKQNPFLSRWGKKRFLMPKKGNKGKCPKLGQTELCPGWLATRRRRFSAEAGSKTARAERESRTAANERHEPPPPPSPLQTRRRGRATPGRPRRRGRHGAFERGRERNRTTRTANERPSGTRRGGGRRSPSRRQAHSPRPPPGAAQGEAAAPYLFDVHRECALARPCSWLLSWWLPSSEREEIREEAFTSSCLCSLRRMGSSGRRKYRQHIRRKPGLRPREASRLQGHFRARLNGSQSRA